MHAGRKKRRKQLSDTLGEDAMIAATARIHGLTTREFDTLLNFSERDRREEALAQFKTV